MVLRVMLLERLKSALISAVFITSAVVIKRYRAYIVALYLAVLVSFSLLYIFNVPVPSNNIGLFVFNIMYLMMSIYGTFMVVYIASIRVHNKMVQQ